MFDVHGVRDGWLSLEGARATTQRDGYGRYFRFTNGQGDLVPGYLFLCVNYSLWASRGDTPLWLWLDGPVPVDVNLLRDNVPSLVAHGSGTDVPIYLTTGVEYEAVLADVVRQVRAIANMVNGT